MSFTFGKVERVFMENIWWARALKPQRNWPRLSLGNHRKTEHRGAGSRGGAGGNLRREGAFLLRT